MNFFQIVNKLMTDILLSDEFVYTVNNYDYIVTVWLTRSGIVELKKMVTMLLLKALSAN